jgi:hypothetical protein
MPYYSIKIKMMDKAQRKMNISLNPTASLSKLCALYAFVDEIHMLIGNDRINQVMINVCTVRAA